MHLWLPHQQRFRQCDWNVEGIHVPAKCLIAVVAAIPEVTIRAYTPSGTRFIIHFFVFLLLQIYKAIPPGARHQLAVFPAAGMPSVTTTRTDPRLNWLPDSPGAKPSRGSTSLPGRGTTHRTQCSWTRRRSRGWGQSSSF